MIWTPISEKLPERSDQYLVTWKLKNQHTTHYFLGLCYWFAEGKEWNEDEHPYKKVHGKKCKIIAWAELPMPYEGGWSNADSN